MQWEIVVALAVMIPVILLPVVVFWYPNISRIGTTILGKLDVDQWRVPTPVLMVLAPFIGLAYILLFPFIGLGIIIFLLGCRAERGLENMWRTATQTIRKRKLFKKLIT